MRLLIFWVHAHLHGELLMDAASTALAAGLLELVCPCVCCDGADLSLTAACVCGQVCRRGAGGSAGRRAGTTSALGRPTRRGRRRCTWTTSWRWRSAASTPPAPPATTACRACPPGHGYVPRSQRRRFSFSSVFIGLIRRILASLCHDS